MLYDLSWTFCFTIYDCRLLRDFLISCLLTCPGITCLCVPMLSIPFSMLIFRFRLLIYMYLLDFRFTVVSLISFMLLVIACTCIPGAHHLIRYTCDCQSTPTGFIICARRVVFWQPWILMSRSWSLDRGGLAVADQSAQRKRGLAVAYPDPLSSSFPLFG